MFISISIEFMVCETASLCSLHCLQFLIFFISPEIISSNHFPMRVHSVYLLLSLSLWCVCLVHCLQHVLTTWLLPTVFSICHRLVCQQAATLAALCHARRMFLLLLPLHMIVCALYFVGTHLPPPLPTPSPTAASTLCARMLYNKNINFP